MKTGLRGHVIDAPEFGSLRNYENGAVVFDSETGSITSVGIYQDDPGVTWLETGATRPVILPGLIDVHAHLPQYPAVARTESALLPWLEKHIFPLEREFREPGAREIADAFFAELLANGTTTSMLYAAIWEDSCEAAFQAAEASGARAIIGKVMMDDGTYSDLEPAEAREISIEQSRRLAKRWHGAAGGRLHYAVSPRFAVTCSAGLMEDAANLAKETGAYIQTHLSENNAEIEFVKQRFPESRSYTDVYDQAGLLNAKSILGHCIHLSGEEMDTLTKNGAKIAHCPGSNFFLNSGLFPMDKLRASGIPIGLASDVAGGPELSMFAVMRDAVNMQKARHFQDRDTPMLTPSGALHLATAGGAEVLSRPDLGRLESGATADITIVDLDKVLPLAGKFTSSPSASAAVDAIVYRANASAVAGVVVGGKKLI